MSEEQEKNDVDYLRDLARRIFAIPVMYGTDQYDCGRLEEIARQMQQDKDMEVQMAEDFSELFGDDKERERFEAMTDLAISRITAIDTMKGAREHAVELTQFATIAEPATAKIMRDAADFLNRVAKADKK